MASFQAGNKPKIQNVQNILAILYTKPPLIVQYSQIFLCEINYF